MEPKTIELTSKQNIIRVAFALFLENGYKEVTIKNIMKATGLSKGAIYHHFTSKEEIYTAALDTYYFDLLLSDQLRDLTGDFEQDITFIYKYVASMFQNVENLTETGLKYPVRDFFRFQLESEKNDEIRKKIYQAVLQYRKIIRNLVQSAKDSGQLRDDIDVEIIAMQIIGLIEGIAIHHSTQKENIGIFMEKKYKQIFDEYFKLIKVQ